MKKKLQSSSTATFIRTSRSSAIEAGSYQKTILENGVRVVSEYIPYVHSVSLGMWITVGSRYETELNNGITHFIEHIAFKGTNKRTAAAIAKSLEQVGGYLNAYTSKEHTCFYARVLDEYAPLAFDVLADLITNATLKPKDIEKEKLVVIEEIKQMEDDPLDCVHEYFEQEVYQNHPLHFPILGSPKNIESFTQEEIIEFYHKYYNAQNIIVASAGNLKHDELLNLCNKNFKKNPNYLSLLHNDTDAVVPQQRSVEILKPIQQTHICIGTIGYGAKHDKRFASQVLNTFLGEGMSSRLFQNIRERYGIAYSVYSFNNQMSDTGTVGVYIATDPSQAERCIELVWNELEKIKSGLISKALLQRTKTQIKGNLLLGLESVSNRMSHIASNELYYGQFIPLEEMLNSIEAVTLDDIIQVGQELYQPSRTLLLLLRPDTTIEALR
ncbi:MAG TPA: pitrilysin family protein [Bacteroidota bacterium]|nr:pitrilysin family protein [Bacteroidota bacterium]